jgi:dsDNA-specific endonuclease/ATPase MutS2
MALRAKANQEGDAMARCFDQSHAAYEAGDGARAKQLSEEGKAHQREMERLNTQASEWIFVGQSFSLFFVSGAVLISLNCAENNKDSKPGEIDLHGLYVKEAIRYTDQSIEEARRRGDSEIHLIVGKGLHSAGRVAKIKPAIEDLMRK